MIRQIINENRDTPANNDFEINRQWLLSIS